MRTIVALGGVPGTGKSSIMMSLLDRYGDNATEVKMCDLLYGYVIMPIHTAVLGMYKDVNETFPGTDRLSMAVQPRAQEWIEQHPKVNVLFEGDRLFNRSFLQFCADLPSTKLVAIILSAPHDELERRYAARGSYQSQKFLASRATKYNNIMNDMMLSEFVVERRNANHADQSRIIEEVMHELQ